VADGVLTRATDDDGNELRGRFEMVANVQAYIRHIEARRQFDAPGESEYVRLRNERMAREGELSALRLDEIRGKLHRSDDVEFAVTSMITACRSRLLSIPSRITRQLIGKRSFKEIYGVIYNEIVLALRELSGYDARKFSRQSEEFLKRNGDDDENGNENGKRPAAR
jgi:hypothetical protein